MAVNEVILNGTTLIDLTDDTVSAGVLLRGYSAHMADGTVITGTMFAGYPSSVSVTDGLALTTQDGDPITAQDGSAVYGQEVYAKL